MITSESFKKKEMGNTINIKALKNVACNGEHLKKGQSYKVPFKDGNSLINYGDAELCEEKTQAKPKTKKTAKKKTAKSEPVVNAQR